MTSRFPAQAVHRIGHLDLWKPNSLLQGDPLSDLTSFVRGLQLNYLEENNDATLLSPVATVEHYYTDPSPRGYVHIIAQLSGQHILTVTHHDTARTGITLCGHDSKYRHYSTLPTMVSIIARDATVSAARKADPPSTISGRLSLYKKEQNKYPIYKRAVCTAKPFLRL